MTDMVENVNGTFEKSEYSTEAHDNELGHKGLWCVFNSRDYITEYEDNRYKGISIYNCCGESIIAIKK